MKDHTHNLKGFYDPVGRPRHYVFDYPCSEVKDVVEERLQKAGIPAAACFWYGNAIKYIMRWPFKGSPKQDLDKAIQCLTEVKRYLEEQEEYIEALGERLGSD